MGITQNTKNIIYEMYSAGYTTYEIAEAVGVPEAVVVHVLDLG